MNNQEAFEKVVKHLSSQGWMRSLSSNEFNGTEFIPAVCAYRGDEGRMCAIGIFMSDEVYDPEWEGSGVSVSMCDACGLNDVDIKLLIELQKFHDGGYMSGDTLHDIPVENNLNNFRRLNLTDIAIHYKLDTEFFKEVDFNDV